MPPNSTVPPTYVPAEALPETLGINASLRPSVSWQAVFAGAVIAIAIELLLAVLGVAVGLTVANPGPAGSGGGGLNGLGLGAGIWWIVSSIISLLIGGYSGARLANVPSRFDGLLQGLVIWGVVVLVSVWVLSAAATGLVRGVVTALGGTVSAVSHGVAATAPEVSSAFGTSAGQAPTSVSGQSQNAMRDDVASLLQAPNQPPQQMSHEQAAAAITQSAPELLAGGDKATAAKNRIAAIVAAQLNISQQDAEKRVDDFQQKLVQAKTKAGQAAQNAASEATGVASDAAYAIFVFLVVTGLAGAVGGILARPRRLLRADGDHWTR